jgi:hypothetical protein
MGDILKNLPNWVVLAIIGYVAVLLTIAMYDNRKVDFWPLSIHPKGTGSGPASATPARPPWVSIGAATPAFPLADCPARLPASLNLASAEKVKPATWGDSGGLWFGELKGNTVWLGCRQVGAETVVMVGAAGPEADSTKGAVDLLVGLVSR